MYIELLVVGRTDESAVAELIAKYFKRINRYVKFNIVTVPDLKGAKNYSQAEKKSREGQSILKQLEPSDMVVLLDENGREVDSVGFAGWLEGKIQSSVKKLVFVIGGAYGFSEEVQRRADGKLSLSRMTFSHQLIRVIFSEQLYRAFTIINKEPYHHI